MGAQSKGGRGRADSDTPDLSLGSLSGHTTRLRLPRRLTMASTPSNTAATTTAPPPTMRRPASWSGAASQADLMLTDQVITVNENDSIIGGASKRDAHTFSAATPSGALHRAFSVFLFDGVSGRLLLQQRAASKITFPGVWTNTCCSHQLHGQTLDEVDDLKDVEAGHAPGAIAAAQRKLEHELGIPSGTVPDPAFRFVTRLHYCAPDTDTHGPASPWGEHEVDYILLARVDGAEATLPLAPHPEEVDATRWVSQSDLDAMMAPSTGLKWSPWFRIIAGTWLRGWWGDLEGVVGRGEGGDWGTVHKVVVRGEGRGEGSV